MFFVETQQSDDPCMVLAQQLYTTARMLGSKHLKKSALPGWARMLRVLASTHTLERVQAVMAWYEKNALRDFVPQAKSAHAFVSKFDNIVQTMEGSDDTVIVGHESLRVARRLLDHLEFPPEIASRLAVLVQRTRQAWDSFAERILDQKVNDREYNFLTRVLEVHGRTFHYDWFVFLNQKYGRSPRYVASPDYLVFRPTSTWFRESFWRRWSQDWCGSPIAFEALLDKLL